MNAKVDAFLKRAKQWQEESKKLRAISLECGLTEDLKWGKPCYTFQESNILIIQGFKDYCALMFCKGALLKDTKGILVKPGESTQAARQARFTNLREIVALESTLKAYIRESMEAEKAGLKVDFKVNPEPVPEELQSKLDGLPAFKAAFEALTPGRQRGYILYFIAAKQSKTRAARVEKCIPQILKGKGLND
ncbi:MAG TPA: YdeI/OmpD-associated family protein [Candidatus Limnocylindria bacterium]|nr:YdeI/OmpD-associated family protein [Candidatus Limnocylindria bacterium]